MNGTLGSHYMGWHGPPHHTVILLVHGSRGGWHAISSGAILEKKNKRSKLCQIFVKCMSAPPWSYLENNLKIYTVLFLNARYEGNNVIIMMYTDMNPLKMSNKLQKLLKTKGYPLYL